MANKFYVHNDIFRYEDEVFGDSEAELDEGKMFTNIPNTPGFLNKKKMNFFMVYHEQLKQII